MENEFHHFFYCKFHVAARAILCIKVCNISTDNKLAEHFHCLSNDELLRLFLFGLSDGLTQIYLDGCLLRRRCVSYILQ